uniref:ATP synthase subunit a n=1 Tax=Oroperipatus sp. DVL-2011 TaxID=1035536 RepID=G1CDU4_9BILA|nr:ATP synthase F0 subunit 6 [Oroperipatus sp. DVL-2011]AEK48376.1 ATP synthase F0 subunit 6 [Oroperipatus sp. DVL-2011]
MMMNLFSVFDPSSSVFMLSLNWISLGVGMMVIPIMFWLFPSRILVLGFMMFDFLKKELKVLLGVSYISGVSLIFVSMFLMILLNNVLGLMPYVFTSTSHLLVTLSLAFPLWISFLIFGWLNKMMMMFAHCVPLGTPWALMSFMVCIETVSNFIRPLTLSVRLSANMIAGHLLLSLVGMQGSVFGMIMFLLLFIGQTMLMLLESAVAIIQSYVFVVLGSLYLGEVY